MKPRLARVDLSDDARDFRAVAVEPGVAVLDTAGNNAQLLGLWLGRFVAEPVWEGGQVAFWLPEEQPRRVTCRPVTPARLHGPLRGELAELREKIEAVRPGSQFERLLHGTISDAFHELTNDPKRTDVGCYFLEYRDAEGRWRLVWLPGYERVRREKATGRLCTRSRCGLLYAQRQGYAAKCPVCDPKGAARRVTPVPWKWVAAGAVVALLLAVFLIWYLGREDGGEVAPGWPKLAVTPEQVVLWPDETGKLERVEVVPGEDQTPVKVGYRLEIVTGGDIVAVEGDDTLKALAKGTAKVSITAIDPNGPHDGLSGTVPVVVTELKSVSVEPEEVSIDIGDATPKFTVMARGEEGEPRKVEAPLESLDEDILAPVPAVPGRFIAEVMGGTSVRAEYRGHEAYADVTVRGERFRKVDATLNEHTNDFTVTFDVLAAASQGELEYCVHLPEEAPPDAWVPAKLTEEGDHREVTVVSQPIPYGPRNARYQLIIEARSPTGSVQRYPFSFRLAPTGIVTATEP